jgi:hypothetical protein
MGEFERPRLNVAIPWPASGPKTALNENFCAFGRER